MCHCDMLQFLLTLDREMGISDLLICLVDMH